MDKEKYEAAKKYLKWRIENDVPTRDGYLSDYISFESIKTILNVLFRIENLEDNYITVYLQGFSDSEEKYKSVLVENIKLKKVINEMSKALFEEFQGYEPCPLKNKMDCENSNCKECIKQYFYKKADEK